MLYIWESGVAGHPGAAFIIPKKIYSTKMGFLQNEIRVVIFRIFCSALLAGQENLSSFVKIEVFQLVSLNSDYG